MDAPTRLPITNGSEKAIDCELLIQCIIYYEKEACSVNPNAEVYFELEEDELVRILSVAPENVQLSSFVTFRKARKALSLCERLTATVGRAATHFDNDRNGTLVRRGAIEG